MCSSQEKSLFVLSFFLLSFFADQFARVERIKKIPQYSHVLESGKVHGISGTVVSKID